MSEAELLSAQRNYYRARAPEYDAWWERQGRYDRGQAANAKWFSEAAALELALEEFQPHGKILELACGTGLWTRLLLPHAEHLTAVDAAPEMIAQNRARLGTEAVEYLQEDLFEWEPLPGAYDFCFFGFWLSHVPEGRFDAFWKSVARALAPGGRVFFIDSDRSDRSSASDHSLPPADDDKMLRRLDDGREYCIVKRFYTPEWLERRLARLGWRIEVRRTGEFFIYGAGGPADGRAGARAD